MNEADVAAPASGPILDEEGHFHATDAPIELSHYLIEDWLSLGFFWLLGLCVFYQFFTRYVLNDSAAWTEEIARYLLICTVFVGIASAVRRTRHIHVDFVYRLIPAKAGRAASPASWSRKAPPDFRTARRKRSSAGSRSRPRW